MKKYFFLFLVVISQVAHFTIAGAVTIDTGKGNRVFVPVKSFKTLRDENLVKQAYDYSCGAAALATILTYGLGDKVTEQEVLSEAMTSLSREDYNLRKKEGLSLLDLQHVSMVRGHKAQGFRLSPGYLSQLARPVMVFIRPRDYEHFAVLKGVRGDNVYLADPSLGNVRMPMYRFLDMWLDESGKGIILAVERSDGRWPENYQLKLPLSTLVNPGLLSTRQLLEKSRLSPYLIKPVSFMR